MNKKRQPIFKFVLLVMLIVAFGAVLFVQTQISGLQRQQEVLLEELGDFRNTDVNKIRVLQMETNNPYRFKWRFVLPSRRNFEDHFEFETGRCVNNHFQQYGIGWGKTNYDAAIFFEFNTESLAIHQTGFHDAKHTFPNGKKLADFLRRHWQELQIDTVGSRQVSQFAADGTVELFVLRIPPKLIETFEQEFSGPIVDRVKSGPLFRYSICPL